MTMRERQDCPPRAASELLGHVETRPDFCERHGAFVARRLSRLRFWFGCPACQADEIERKEAEARARVQAERQRRWQQLLGGACIPERFRTRTLEGFEAHTPAQQRALAMARDYARDFDEALKVGRCALFLGGTGTGKSHLASAICMKLLNEGRTVYYTTVMRAVQDILDTRRPGSVARWSDAMGLLTKPDLLVLDEVGVQLGSNFERAVLSEALNSRYEHCRPVLVLSNLNAAEVRDYLGQRVFDRMKDGDARVVIFDWESYRGRAHCDRTEAE